MRTLGLTCVVSLLVVLGNARVALAAGSCGSGGVKGMRVMVPFQGSLYYVTTPATYADGRPWPLIFGLHGDEGDPARSVNSRWRTVTNDQFIFVAPKAPNAGGSWYRATETNSQWMDALLAQVLAQYNVDLDRITIWGLSGGAVFNSTYALSRANVFAAVEFNMGGSGRRIPPGPCKIPARFVVGMTDFLRMNAQGLYGALMAAGHEAVWVDAACQGHCFDPVEAGVNARDWLLAHTLCGAAPTTDCRQSPPPASGSDGGVPADAGGAPGDAGSPPADAGGARADSVGMRADAGAMGSDAGASPGPTPPPGTPPPGTPPPGMPPAPAPEVVPGNGCACDAPGSPPAGTGNLGLFAFVAVAVAAITRRGGRRGQRRAAAKSRAN
jgi:predicted esterase